MLVELNIEDFAIIDQVGLKFAQGFNVLTGETGAGKSIIIDAVMMLLGGRADTTLIRAKRDRARIEGIFRLSANLQAIIDPKLEREGLEGDEPDILILGREIRSTGRSFCRVNGRTVNLSILEEVARPLIDIHGQTEHLSLMQVRQHQRFLDRYAGLKAPREKLAAEVRQLRKVRQELADLMRDEQYLARRTDQLSFQVEEILAANLKPGEEADLEIERNRLANAEQLSQLTNVAYALLVEGEDSEQVSIIDLLGQVARVVNNLGKLEQSWVEQHQMIENLTYQVEDLASFVRDYREGIDFNPARLHEIEGRLGLIFSLKRKYGSTVEEIIEFGRRAETELETITHNEEHIESLRESEDALRRKIGQQALSLSEARQQAARSLAQEVEAQLADLRMEKAKFNVDIQWVEATDGVFVDSGRSEEKVVACDEQGIDRVEFKISANPGEPPKPLAKIASGGETSRIMLALKTVLATADETPTLIFDEIDQGIGGRIGGKVGRKLWGLTHSGGHQVLCVTHLPQIAGYAEQHYHVDKQITQGRTQTGVRILSNDEQVEELAQMMGALSKSTRQSAREILSEAAAAKVSEPIRN
jgi:DNA repair protein RecN (Recombination protein N)